MSIILGRRGFISGWPTILGLVATGGSDFHGRLMPDIRLGRGFGGLRVPEEVLAKLEARNPGRRSVVGPGRWAGWSTPAYRLENFDPINRFLRIRVHGCLFVVQNTYHSDFSRQMPTALTNPATRNKVNAALFERKAPVLPLVEKTLDATKDRDRNMLQLLREQKDVPARKQLIETRLQAHRESLKASQEEIKKAIRSLRVT